MKCKGCETIVRIPLPSPVYTAPPMPAAPPIQQRQQPPRQQQETELYHSHPSMFRNRPILFLICIVLSLLVVGLLPLGVWWFSTKFTTLTVTNRRTTFRRGFFSKRINEVWHKDVRNVLVEQSFLQRIFGTGTIGISSAGSGTVEIVVNGMPSPYEVKEIIDAGRF